MTSLNSTPEALSQFNDRDVLQGLAATLSLNFEAQSPQELVAVAKARVTELAPLANGEREFDAYQLERSMLQAMLNQLQGSFDPEQSVPTGTVLH